MKPLTEKALLVTLNRRMFSNTVTDKAATDMVASATNVRKGRYKKSLFTTSAGFAAVREAYQALYAYHTGNTLPWEDRVARLLPSDMYFEYTYEMRKRRGDCDAMLRLWLQNYASDVAQDMQVLGALASPQDYPTEDQMKAVWGHNVVVQPIPAVADFRVDVGDEALAELESHITARVQAAQGAVVASLLEPLKAAAEKLAVPIGEEGSVFRDSLVENIRDVAQRMQRLVSLTDNPALVEAVRNIAQTAAILPAPEVLRHSPTMRGAICDEVQGQIDTLVSLFGGAQ